MKFETASERERRREKEGEWNGVIQDYVSVRVCDHNGRITYRDEGRRRIFVCQKCGKKVRPSSQSEE